MGKRVKNEEFDFSDIVDSDEQFDFNDVTDEENEFDFSDVVEEAPKGTVKTGWGNSINPTEHPLIKFGTGLVKSAASFIKDQLPKTHALVDQEANLDYARRFQTMLDEELAKPNPSQKNVEWLRGAIAQWRDQAVDAEQEIATQNEDTSNTLEGVNQDLFESKSVGDVSSFLGSMVGQGLPQLVLAGVTRGTSSYVQESAAIWDQQMDQLSQKYNLSREEVIEKGLDEPAASKAYAILAAGLDAASAGSVLSRFRKAAGSGKSVIKDLGLEGSTEAAQGNIERFAASQGAGTESNLLSTENAKSSVNEFVGGVAGAGPLSILSTHKKAAVKAAEQAIEETSSGTPEIDAIIDEAGTLTPEESQALAEIKVAEQEEATLDIVNKTDDSVNNNLQSAENTATIAAEAEIDTPEFKQVSKEVEDLRSQIANLPVTASQEEGFKLFVKFTEAREKLQNLIKVGPPRDADLQYSLFDAVDQKIKVTDAEGNTGTLKLDQGGKLTLENSSKIIELGNLDTEIDPATPIRDFGLKLSKTAEPRQEKSVKMTPNEAIKQQVQTFYKGVQEGVYRGKDASNELVNKVQEAIKESPLSAKQVSTILTKVRKTNLFTPGSISRLNTFIDKVSSDAEYAEQVSQTEEVNSDVKGLLKKSTPKERSVLQVFSALESDDLQSLPKHIALGNLIKKSNRPVNSQDFVPLNLESVNRYVTDATTQIYESEFGRKPVNMTPEQMFNEVQKQRYRQRSEERVNKIADDLGLNFDERQLLLQSDTEVEDKIADENKKEKLKDQLVNIARTVGSRLKTVPTEDYKDILDRVKSVKPDELSITDLKKYIEVVERITENNDFGDSSDIAAIGAAQKGIEILLPKIKKHIIGLTGIEADYTASLSQAFKSIFGLSTEAATFQENSGIKGISDAHAYSLEDEEAIVNKFNSMHDEFKNKKNNGFSTESIFRRGLYKTLIKHDAAVDGDEYLRTKGKPAIETTIRSYRSIGDEESAKVVEALYEPFKNVQTIKEASEVMERIDPLSKQVFDEVVKWYDRYKPEVKKYNEVYYGDFSQDIVNYAGETHVRPVGIKLTEIDDMMYKPGTLKPKRLDSSRRFSGSVPEGSIVDLNFDVNVVRHIKKLSFELKAHPYVAQVEAFAKQKEKVLEMFGYQKGIPETLKKAQNIYDKIFDRNDGLYKSFLDDSYGIGRMSKSDQNIAKTLSAVHKLVYTATLSGITQAPKQYTVLASTAINLGTDAGVVFSSIVEIAQNKSDFKELIKGESVSSRGREASVVNLGNWLDASEFLKTESTIKKLFSSQFPDQIDRVFNSMWGGLKPLITTDASAAQISWLSYYKQHLKSIGQEYKGLTEENNLRDTPERREARAFAKQRVDETQVSSNPAELAKAAKTRAITGQLAKAQFMPFGSFNLSKKQRLATNAKIIAFGTKEQRAAAIKDTVAAYAESIAFIAVKRGLQASFGAGITYALRELYNLDDPEDDEEKKQRETRQFAQDVTDWISDVVPVTLLAAEPVKLALIDGVEELIYWWHKQENPDLKKTEFYKETGLDLRPKPKDDLWWLDYLGNYGIMVDNIYKGFDYAEDASNDTMSTEQQRLAGLAAFVEFISFGLMPADIRNPIVSEYLKQRKDAKQNAPKSTNTYRPNRPRIRRIQPIN